MHLLTIPPGGRAKAHMHESHETAIYMLSGEAHTWYGDRLEHHVVVRAGEMFYIPAGVPHLPANFGDTPASAVIARTDPNEQESVVLLPHLEALDSSSPDRRLGARRDLVEAGAVFVVDHQVGGIALAPARC